jgi:uncharacterized protein (DUF2147 family)
LKNERVRDSVTAVDNVSGPAGEMLLEASPHSVEGYWKTVDDNTREVKSIVRIWKDKERLLGKIIKTFPKAGEDPDPVCDKCKGEKKNQKIIGMIFMWQFHLEDGRWVEGRILDPENGKVYNCSLELTDNSSKLKVFGYIRLIVKIGRSQTWLRATEKDLAGIAI